MNENHPRKQEEEEEKEGDHLKFVVGDVDVGAREKSHIFAVRRPDGLLQKHCCSFHLTVELTLMG